MAALDVVDVEQQLEEIAEGLQPFKEEQEMLMKRLEAAEAVIAC